jgi:hypothetical protein
MYITERIACLAIKRLAGNRVLRQIDMRARWESTYNSTIPIHGPGT